ncbi:MAG: mersacidin/lichenicidin family type 2 lantibiotic [Calothrix sp. MO_192.B10]|nr:mersacidin/lichenicidin family type 2 lantibiotic [Calothrix sp. MO_192.B10]
MSKEDIIRAWKDPEYRNSLSEEQRSQLPENPAGVIELTDSELEVVAGGVGIDLGTISPESFCCATIWKKRGGGCPNPVFLF